MHVPTLGEIFAYLFDVSDLLASALDPATNVITGQLGDVTKGRADSDVAELWYGSPGIVGRPALATQGKASCQAVCLKRSDHDIAFAYRDLRNSTIYGKLAPGETCVFATTGQARTLWKKDGSVTHVTTSDNTDGGQTMPLRWGPDGLTVTTPWGQLSMKSDGFKVTVGQTSLWLKTDGTLELLGQKIDAQGQVSSFVGQLGTFIGKDATPDPGHACAVGPGTPLNLASTNVFIGGITP